MIGVAERGLEQEAVELRLGQSVGAGLLDRVLGGHDQEGGADRAGHAVDGDLALFHDLEQGRLGLGACAVDLVGEDDVGEDRSHVELELPLLLVVHRDTGDIAGKQIGGELDAAARALNGAPHGAGKRRLARPRVILQQQVALGDHRREGQLDDVALSEHDLFDVGDQAVKRLLEPVGLFGGEGHADPFGRAVLTGWCSPLFRSQRAADPGRCR